jgi:hypothetical protein
MVTGGFFHRGYSGRGAKLTTHLHVVPGSGMVEPGTTLPYLYIIIIIIIIQVPEKDFCSF